MPDADDYGRQLSALVPPGSLFPQNPDSTWRRLLAAIGDAFARVESRALDLLNELDPRSTVELLPEWEKLVGLPDDCFTAPTTLQERRNLVVQRFTAQPSLQIAYFLEVAAQLGYPDVTIEELGPFICGVGICSGTQLSGSDTDRFYFLVRVGSARVTYFRAGASRASDRLGAFEQADDLECVLNRIKPAHTVMIFSYEGV